MRRFLERLTILGMFIGAPLLVLALQEQYPGQSEHKRPPDGYFCSDHPDAPADHKCACKKSCVPEVDDEGNPTGRQTVQEDVKCSVYCHADRCACKVPCQST